VLDSGGKLGMNLCAFTGYVHGLKQRFFAVYADETVFAARNKSILNLNILVNSKPKT
jgi:hypothetical protein